jgi:endonuclease YncB( thermonuclease family)
MARPPFNVVPLRPKRRAAPARAWWRQVTPIVVVLPLATFAAVFVFGLPTRAAADLPQPAAADSETARFALCDGRGSAGGNCVIDGDTFWYAGEKIRIADINTPETSAPECAREAELGAAATGRMLALLNQGAFTLEPVDRDRDRYGRLLRTVTRDGESLGAVLVGEGLAEEWRGYRGNWC